MSCCFLLFLVCFFVPQVSNVIFALFTEGLLKVCDKLSNPCSLEETSFSERVYGRYHPRCLFVINLWYNLWHGEAYCSCLCLCLCLFLELGTFMFNNCRALRAGHLSYAQMKSKTD
jgi:hypothetical protein